jgi:hypothetical protein
MPNEMIERVARALCRADNCDPDHESSDPIDAGLWTRYEPDARTAIEAMREPTEAMWEAGATELYGHPREKAEEWAKSEKYESWGFDAERAYQKMIDAALSEERSPVVTPSA